MLKVEEENRDEHVQELLRLASPPIPWDPPTFVNITKLNLDSCGLASLPSCLPRVVPNLSILFCPKNHFVELPAVVGSCRKLQMVSFKSNGLKTIHKDALQPQLRWLILTDNELEALPSSIGHCRILQKLMLSGNQLVELPDGIANCHNLELVRLASNQLANPPMHLLGLPNLAWVALAGNPFLSNVSANSNTLASPKLKVIDDPHLDDPAMGKILGTGASGITRQVMWNGKPVAVKSYQGNMTSDGDPSDERQLSVAVSTIEKRDCLIQILGQTPKGSLVMELLCNYEALANPPSMETCSRDVYAPEAFLTLKQAMTIISGLLSTLTQLHAHGICHGDFYGHNILIHKEDDFGVKLSDFGAAFFYNVNSDYGKLIETIEMRCFGHLIDEIVSLLQKAPLCHKDTFMCDPLKELANACRSTENSFSTIQQKLTSMKLNHPN